MAPLWVDLWREFSRSRKGFGLILVLVLVLMFWFWVEPGMEREARGRRLSFLASLRGWKPPPVPERGLEAFFPHAVLRNWSKSLCLACCMRRAASVSLMSPAMRCRVATVRPGRRYCWGLGSDNSVSSGVW